MDAERVFDILYFFPISFLTGFVLGFYIFCWVITIRYWWEFNIKKRNNRED